MTLEFGVLIQPFRELRDRTTPPSEADYRLAIAKVRGGDPAWRKHVREFTEFAPDVRFEQEYQDISHVPERLWNNVNSLIDGSKSDMDPAAIHQMFDSALFAAEMRFRDLMSRVPIPWQATMFPANTPFTSYLRILEAVSSARTRVHYFDRYLKPPFFDLFLRGLPRSIEVRLVTTDHGAKAVGAVSDLARAEFNDYRLITVDPANVHDRNLRVDHEVFVLGPGVDRAGLALTNFSPAENTAEAHAELDRVIQMGIVVHRS